MAFPPGLYPGGMDEIPLVPVSQAPRWARESLRGLEADLKALPAVERREGGSAESLHRYLERWARLFPWDSGATERDVRLFLGAAAGVVIRSFDLEPRKARAFRQLCCLLFQAVSVKVALFDDAGVPVGDLNEIYDRLEGSDGALERALAEEAAESAAATAAPADESGSPRVMAPGQPKGA